MPAPALRPSCAALAVMVRGDRVLLVRRANPPDAGLWGFPGGRIEWGETAAAAAARELAEETGIQGTPGAVLPVIEAVDRAADGTVRHHYLMVPVLCRWQAGDGAPADDALEVGWFTAGDLETVATQLSDCVAEVARLAFQAAHAA